MKTERIDQYLCLDLDKIIADEMNYILENDCGSAMDEDVQYWEKLQEAAKVILDAYTV